MSNGSMKSLIDISFVNLVKIVPIGFESKNTTGALNNFQDIWVWSFCEAVNHESATIKHLQKLTRIYNRITP